MPNPFHLIPDLVNPQDSLRRPSADGSRFPERAVIADSKMVDDRLFPQTPAVATRFTGLAIDCENLLAQGDNPGWNLPT